jgi:hypothetical protein
MKGRKDRYPRTSLHHWEMKNKMEAIGTAGVEPAYNASTPKADGKFVPLIKTVNIHRVQYRHTRAVGP